ncbi:protein of unknown function [Candidatus Nitrosocosmicus franklandus]|uniref:Uncharacterized protein n=1 Tax=Candidatus Nitrosocosmicus franklandianus TaxID=1798806 RepID=A0A484I969_9ARCH|nr:protein of unknown function [Candidatus Nitrosocosmicus franklandus]
MFSLDFAIKDFDTSSFVYYLSKTNVILIDINKKNISLSVIHS